jgi:sporulation protein YlmC with PRC-barrel domain
MADRTEKLTIEAQICLTCAAELPTAVCRGMSICNSNGEQVGQVAAVLLDGRSHEPTHLILTRLLPEYRLVPLSHIVSVSCNCVTLDIANEQLTQLSLHKPSP